MTPPHASAPRTPPCTWQGTTTNGKYLLNFKTGAFLAGLPLQPVILKYDLQSPISPCWDTINILRHVRLLFLQPWHNVMCYEVWGLPEWGLW